ncbi:aminodeoxychorismate synthase component I [Sphingomonas donggukensis]|uniref:Probable branched-chain-amino-acid aminotransferase n=1 Tax=Sphingomonas donggukensis TaxID=2949093 RepID=A0ABY4TUY3_9SPHN|nr:aminodeoxychorismate synthase component I [Sphingomonas donggukensis]URW76200.1 aminodeoxychorismate synthase component I [Sphingomonas donggukensis]
MLNDDMPFVLLDDLRPSGGPARLYRAPIEIIVAADMASVPPALARLRAALAEGRHAAGYMAYEAGFALEPGLAGIETVAPEGPLVWCGVFEGVTLLSPGEVAAWLPDPAGAYAGAPVPRIDADAYRAAFARVADYIVAGDIYQANLSFRADVPFAGHPAALYARLRTAGSGGWGGIVGTGDAWLLSTSPELFFTLEGGALTARPMKGTAPRGRTAVEDRDRIAALVADPKERAENLMIVDLLRNDLSRIAEAGSVAVPALFEVETYPTLHTLTSTVTARIAEGRDAIDVIAATFPCGSITGAPKIRAMGIIAEVEGDARGAYTGSMGWLAPDGDAAFNVLIRTLSIRDGRASVGLGSAVVADSRADGEWAECLAKGGFVTRDMPVFDLIETMFCGADGGVRYRAAHLARLRASAQALGFAWGDVDAALDAAVAGLGEDCRLRLLLSRDGTTAIETAPLPPPMPNPVEVALAPLPVAPDDFRLRHKTTDRAFYDDARTAAGAPEVVFVDRDGFLTEGSFTTAFVERDGRLLTPPLGRGLLPGVLRRVLIDEGRAVEAELTPADLAGGFLIGNSLRGLMPARLQAAGLSRTAAP